LQQQYENQKNICICLKFIIIVEGQISNCNNQIGALMGKYAPKSLQPGANWYSLEGVPQNVQQQICNLQLQLLACIKIKFQICIQLCQYVSSCNNTSPSGPGTIPTTTTVPVTTETSVPTGGEAAPVGETISAEGFAPSGQAAPGTETGGAPVVETGVPTESVFPTTESGTGSGPTGSVPGYGTVPTEGSLPTPGNEFNCCIQLCVIIKIKFELQLSLCNNLAQQCPQALQANQIQPQLANWIGKLRPQFLGQAETACSNNLQSYLQSKIPRYLVPSRIFPANLRKAAQLRGNLENVLFNLAQGAQPFYKLGKPASYIFQQLGPQFNQAQQLQQAYENQKNLCTNLQLIQLIQQQLPGLANQINSLIGQGPKFRLQPYNVGSIPANLIGQVAQLQNQIAPRIRLQFQTFNNLAQQWAPFNINNLEGTGMSPEYSTCVIYICILSLQQQNQLQLAHRLQPTFTPSQLETSCNNEAENLRPTFFNQAQGLVMPAIQKLVIVPSQANNNLRPLQLRHALQLVLGYNIQNQLGQAQNALAGAVGPQRQYLQTLCNELQNRLNAENENAKYLYYLIPIQQNMNQLIPQFTRAPGSQFALINNIAPTRANLANQGKLVFLTNLQHLVNVKLANNQQNAIQALTNCANALGNLMNTAPTRLIRNVYALQRQGAMNALTECQNQYQNMATVQIPQAQLAYQQQNTLCNNLQTACQNALVPNASNIVGEAQNECKSALAIIIDITAIIETNVNTITNVHTQGEPGNGDATVETNVHNNVATSTVGGSSFLSMRKL
jgi:hypothetical protein